MHCIRALPRTARQSLPPEQREGRRSAERRTFHWPRSTDRRYRLKVPRARQRAERSPLAFRRSTAVLATQLNAMAQPRPCFLGLATAGVTLRSLSQSSGAPRAPVLMPEETMPGPPGSRVTSPARRHRTRPVRRPSPATPLRWARLALCCTKRAQSQALSLIDTKATTILRVSRIGAEFAVER
jgi:hypothetical protein